MKIEPHYVEYRMSDVVGNRFIDSDRFPGGDSINSCRSQLLLAIPSRIEGIATGRLLQTLRAGQLE
jgi:hypothetical protein